MANKIVAILSIVCYICLMKKKDFKKKLMIFEIDSEKLNKGVDDLLNIKTMKDKQEVESYINRLKVVETAIKNSEDNFNVLFQLHSKLGKNLLEDMRNPTSLKVSEDCYGWCIYNKHKNPNVILTANLSLQAICEHENCSWIGASTHEIDISSEKLIKEINANGLHGNTLNNNYRLIGNINYCGLIEAVETMVYTLPIYVKAFTEYVKNGTSRATAGA